MTLLKSCFGWLTGRPEARLKALYDCLAPFYFLAHPFVRSVATRAVGLLAESASLEILDICTGTGIVAEQLARRGHRVTGIDISMSMLRQRSGLRRTLSIDGMQMDARVLAFENQSFDLCSVSMGLHEFAVDDRRRILAEMIRVTRRYILIADYSGPQSWPVRFVEHLERSYYRDFTDGSLPVQLRQAGLHIEEQTRWFSIGLYLCRTPHSEP